MTMLPFRLFEVTNTGNLTLNSVTVSNGAISCDFNNCGALGGAIFIASGGQLTLLSSTVSNSQAVCDALNCLAGGGGIGNLGQLTMMNSRVTGNTVWAPSTTFANGRAHGGGVYNFGTALNASGGEISGNTAKCAATTCTSAGGGLINVFAATLAGVRLANNTATCPQGCSALGGGIANVGTLALNYVQTAMNTAVCLPGPACVVQGGGIYSDGGTVNINGGSVTSNTAAGPGAQGGGIFKQAATVTISGATVAANSPDNCEPAIGTCT